MAGLVPATHEHGKLRLRAVAPTHPSKTAFLAGLKRAGHGVQKGETRRIYDP
jgi:hypothetical protein